MDLLGQFSGRSSQLPGQFGVPSHSHALFIHINDISRWQWSHPAGQYGDRVVGGRVDGACEAARTKQALKWWKVKQISKSSTSLYQLPCMLFTVLNSLSE